MLFSSLTTSTSTINKETIVNNMTLSILIATILLTGQCLAQENNSTVTKDDVAAATDSYQGETFLENFLDILLFTFWFFLIFTYIRLVFIVIGDLFMDKSINGLTQFAWAMFILFLPFFGLFFYLCIRGPGMAQRQTERLEAMKAAQDEYIRNAAGTGGAKSPAEQIASAKELLEAGTITQEEFDVMKLKALA